MSHASLRETNNTFGATNASSNSNNIDYLCQELMHIRQNSNATDGTTSANSAVTTLFCHNYISKFLELTNNTNLTTNSVAQSSDSKKQCNEYSANMPLNNNSCNSNSPLRLNEAITRINEKKSKSMLFFFVVVVNSVKSSEEMVLSTVIP